MTGAQHIHLGVAERGKMHALDGQYELALAYYRQAMRMTVAAGDPEILFRHYLTCTVECLERMGCHDEVLAYCDRLIAFYAGRPELDALSRAELAATHERRGAVLMKTGLRAEAEAALRRAVELAHDAGRQLPLAEALLDWLRRGLHVDAHRILSEQERHRYFSVRGDTVEPSRAVELDPRILGAALPI